MRRRSIHFSAALAMVIVIVGAGMGITRNTVTKTLAGISHAAILPAVKPITHGDNAFAPKLSAAIKDLKLRSAKLTRGAKFQQRFNDLMATAQKDGVAHVIAELRVAYQPEHLLADEVERRAQRAAIGDAQNGLLGGLNYNPSSLKTFDGLPFVALSVDPEGLAQLGASPYVLDLTRDMPMKLALHQSLPLIGATKAWAGGFTGAGQTVVILDSGVDKTHHALSGKVVGEACYSTTNTTPTNPVGATSLCPFGASESHDVGSGANCTALAGLGACDHGTHIANIAAGRYGVAFNANIISMQVMSYDTSVNDCGNAPCLISYSSDVVKALNYVYTDLRNTYTHIASVNISLAYDVNADPLGYSTYCDADFNPIYTAIYNLKQVNIPTIIASGNDAFTDALSYPACISAAISVGATGDYSPPSSPTGQRLPVDAVWPNSDSASYLSLLAPGSAITSAVPGGDFASGDGTSMAAAHVSGAMALLRQELPIGANSTVWFDDALPAGAVPWPDDTATGGVDESWNWVSANPTPYSGTASHQSSIVAATNIRQHYFMNATSTLQIGTGEILCAWVYLDQANMPSEIMLQWNDGVSWEHRAYWGANNIQWGVDGTPSRIYMGRLPQWDKWVKLVIPAHAVGLEGKTVSGMAFTQLGGRVTWDQTGKGSASVDDLLTLLRSTGVSVTDTRPGAPPNRSVPRVKVDAALGVNIPDQNWVGEYYNTTDLSGTLIVAQDDGNGFIDKNFNGGSPVSGLGTTNYSIRWTRTMVFTAGTYRFIATGDDGVRLFRDGDNVIDQWVSQGATSYVGVVTLTPGVHVLKFEHNETGGGGGTEARLIWGLYDPNGPCSYNVGRFPSAGTWEGDYFNNINLSGTPAMVVDDTSFATTFDRNGLFSKNWGASSPSNNCSVFPTRYSVRWTSTISFMAATYRFTVNNIADGIRVYYDNNLIIDKWHDNSGTNTSAPIPLSGNHTIKIEYYRNNNPGNVNLTWAPLVPPAPTNLTAAANPSNPTTQITLNWSESSGNIPVDYFVIERLNGGTYSPIGQTINGATTTYTDTGLSLGTVYTYRVKAHNINAAYNNPLGGSSGDSDPSLPYSATTSPCTYVLTPNATTVQYFGTPSSQPFTVSTAAGCSWTVTASESWINFYPSGGTGNGSVNFWISTNDSQYSRSGHITVGDQWFYVYQMGSPFLALPDPLVPDADQRGLTARYFSNTTLSGQPAIERIDPAVDFNWAGNSPAEALPASGFSARWSGQLAAPSSEAYTLYLLSDGGARLWVNNQLAIDHSQPPFQPQTQSAPIELKADAKADIRVEYYNAGGKASIRLLWSSASTPKQVIPQRYLYPEAATNGASPTDTIKQSGMLLPPGSDSGPKAARLQPSGRPAIPRGRAGLALLIACGVSALLLRTAYKELKRTDEQGNKFRWRQRLRMFTAISLGAGRGMYYSGFNKQPQPQRRPVAKNR